MPGPFYNAIKGTSSGAAGTGAFTPSAAPTGFRAWSTVTGGWIGLVRYEDGTSWELSYSYWNGTTLSRASTQLFDSSSGSALILTSAATATMVADAGEIMSHLATTPLQGFQAQGNAFMRYGMAAAATITGTAASVSQAATNYLTEQPRVQITSATTASAQSAVSVGATLGITNSTAGRGGWEYVARFGASQLPTSPRLFAGMTVVTMIASTAEPSAVASNSAAGFALDSTDTNIQLLTSLTGTGSNKTDTGIPLVANGWYETAVWCEPGSTTIYALLVRLDTGAIWFGSTTTRVPATGSTLTPQLICGLNGTNTGTAAILHAGGMFVRSSR